MTTSPLPVRILIVDDDVETCRLIAELVAAPGRELQQCQTAAKAMELANKDEFHLVISDINLNGPASGLDVLKAFKEAHPAAEVVLISGFGTLDTAVQAVRAGAFDYISKPFNIAEVRATVARALARDSHVAAPEARPDVPPEGIIGRTAGMLAVYKQIAYASDSVAPVLIQGESGTGKELVARAIHAHGARAARPFVAVNCGAITETLLESELFGHVRGAFTGAVADRKGVFEQAHGGTVFLDEIGDMAPAMQVKLLRVLQDGEVRPVGGSRAIHTDARVVAATNVDLDRSVAEQRFRQDLYYRLSVIVIHIPALRDRREDIPLLIEQFVRNASVRTGRPVVISPEAVVALTSYRWPGNVRELENTIERLVVFSRGRIELPDLPDAVLAAPSFEERMFQDLPTLDELERRYLVHVLEAVGGNRSRAAEALGIDRRTLYRMAERLG
ncbi:MAG TPA: sigma-54 dependent transcriptional regulator, partial [Vicinamibacterales bacterium]|nr:sigma-54 dependent transcriptional regulator [Vicinamibacterales bacterium]